ncbi:MAG: glycoside hydrolase, end-alpha-1,4-polygalactosaminidase [Desulfobacterales bacterium]|nr:glycoside hydrolase, end-alpha-1,4-polygalactosaminidase [Desulfobacterales bacterium]
MFVNKKKLVLLSITVCLLISNSALGKTLSRKTRLKKTMSWMYQIQGLETKSQINALAKTPYPLLVVEPNFNHRDMTDFDCKSMTKKLRVMPNGKNRLILAYIDVGQAEGWRTYWKKSWVAPTVKKKGTPEFLVTVDPDGWENCYPVAYWKKGWKKIWVGKNGLIEQLAKMCFDGVYIDWVEAYDDDLIRVAAKKDRINPEIEMIKFVEEIGKAGKRVIKDFLVVPQNAPFLIDTAPKRYAAAIDALAVEDTWFHGEADAKWDSPKAGDLRTRHDGIWATKGRLNQYKKYLRLGLPVFSVDYCVKKSNVKMVYKEALKAGLRPLVSRVDLSRITETPPE